MTDIAWDLWAERGGVKLMGRDSVGPDFPLEAVDGGRVRSATKLSGRDAWMVRMSNGPIGDREEEPEEDDDDREPEELKGRDGEALRGRDLWIRRTFERQL